MQIIITKETSKYNKAMKWHLVIINENGGKDSAWFKTEKEALYEKARFENRDVNKYTANNNRL